MMKKIAFVMLCTFLATVSFAQKNKKEVIYLKNGSVIKGQMVRVDDDKLVVRSARNTWVFNNSELDSVSSKLVSTSVYNEKKPWFLKTTAGVLAGSSDNNKSAPFSLMASFNYQIEGGLYAGLGTGVEFLEESYMPAFLNLEYYFRDTYFTPFVSLKGGYLLPLDDKSYTNGYNDYYYSYSSSYWPGPNIVSLEPDGGFFLNPSFGFRGMVHQNLGWMFSFGYRFHELNFSGENEYGIERNYNRLSVSVGIIFN